MDLTWNRRDLRTCREVTKKAVRRFFSVGALLVWIATAFGHDGQVRFGEAPVPGAAVHATRGEVTERAITDADGRYSLPKVTEGTWKIHVSAPGFEPIEREVTPSSTTDATLVLGLKDAADRKSSAKHAFHWIPKGHRPNPATRGSFDRDRGPPPY